jgi:hypothetical protein
MSEGNGATAVKQVPVEAYEVHIRWVPSTGQIQFASTQMDDVLKLGMIEMAKIALAEQRAAAAAGKGPSLIVPGRFVQ